MNDEKWIQLGKLSKQITKDIQKAMLLSQEIMPKIYFRDLQRAEHYLWEFRSKAEDRMFKKGPRDLSIFYGTEDK